MCVFCAAVPLAGSIGIAVTHQANEKKREMRQQGQVPARSRLSPAIVTMVVIMMLMSGSAVYHLVLGPRIGIY